MKSLMDDDENRAVRAFLLLFGGATGVTVGEMRAHMSCSGFTLWPDWVDRAPSSEHLTKAGAQLWLRHLFALETVEQRAASNTGGKP